MLNSSVIYSQCLRINVVYEHSRYMVHTDSKCNECVHQWLWLIAQLVVFYGTHCMLTVTHSDLITFIYVCVDVYVLVCTCECVCG